MMSKIMLAYKDRTFCPYDKCSFFPKCPRALTDKVKQDAIQWWGGDDFPIAMFAGKPKCFNKGIGNESSN